MKIRDMISKLKRPEVKILDLQNCDPDRVGDLLIGLALTATIAGAMLMPLYAATTGVTPVHFLGIGPVLK